MQLLLVFDERMQQDMLDHCIAFHKFKTLYAEGKISPKTSESLQGTAFISFVDMCENPNLVNQDAFCSTVLAVQEHRSFDTEARAGTFLCLPRVPWCDLVTGRDPIVYCICGS